MSSFLSFRLVLRMLACVLALGTGGLSLVAKPEAFYVDYQFNVPTDILTSHRRAIVHPEANVDLAAAAAAGTTVYAYISVGELGPNAPHRAEALSLGLPLRGENPIWNSDLMDLTTGEWAEFLVDSVAKSAVDQGYSGFFLDTLDSVALEANAAEEDAQRAGLVALIKRLHDTYPTRSIIVNRGFKTLPQLVGLADGLLIESVYSAYDFEENFYRPVAAAETAELEIIMEDAVASGFEVFVLDYADPADPEAALAAANRILEEGYHAFVSTPALDGVVLGPWQSAAPSILAEPLGITVRPGQEMGLRVLAAGAPAPTFKWYRDGTLVATRASNQYVVEAAQESDAGEYRVEVSNRYGVASSTTVRVEVNSAARQGRLTNLSTRAWASTGSAQLIPGAVTAGQVRLLARAVGPTLQDFLVTDTLPDPRLGVVRSGVAQLVNDDWEDDGHAADLRAAAVQVGAFALRDASEDAAILFDLSGAATLPVETNQKGEGIALVELYELTDSAAEGVLLNLSIRANLRSVGESIVMGFVLGGESASQLLVRAVGPALSGFGVEGILTDPLIKVYRGEELLAENDDWSSVASKADRIGAKGELVGAFPLNRGSLDAAVVLTLPPGTYTAVVAGQNDSVGVVLAEVYALP